MLPVHVPPGRWEAQPVLGLQDTVIWLPASMHTSQGAEEVAYEEALREGQVPAEGKRQKKTAVSTTPRGGSPEPYGESGGLGGLGGGGGEMM